MQKRKKVLITLMKNNKIKLLVLSDIHGDIRNAMSVINTQPNADLFVFLGDGISDMVYCLDDMQRQRLVAVRGNCDLTDNILGASLKKNEIISLCGKRIMITHGDLYGVKYGTAGIEQLARESGCDIVLFGHTHRPHEGYSDGVYYFNPGSVTGGYGIAPSAGLLTLDGDNVLFSFLTPTGGDIPSPFK